MSIIIKPIVTEKMTQQTEKFNRVGFIVDKKANKVEIKKAVESFYDVKVADVNTISYDGKSKSRYTKAGFLTGRTNQFKKAIITLEKGESINLWFPYGLYVIILIVLFFTVAVIKTSMDYIKN